MFFSKIEIPAHFPIPRNNRIKLYIFWYQICYYSVYICVFHIITCAIMRFQNDESLTNLNSARKKSKLKKNILLYWRIQNLMRKEKAILVLPA